MESACPACGFNEAVTANYCRVCGAALSRAQAVTDWRTVFVARNEWEANLVSGLLEANGIPAHIKDAHLVGLRLGAAFQASGGVEVQIPQAAYQRAMRVLADAPGGRARGMRRDTEYTELQAALAEELRRAKGRPSAWVIALALLALAALVGGLAAIAGELAARETAARGPQDALPEHP